MVLLGYLFSLSRTDVPIRKGCAVLFLQTDQRGGASFLSARCVLPPPKILFFFTDNLNSVLDSIPATKESINHMSSDLYLSVLLTPVLLSFSASCSQTQRADSVQPPGLSHTHGAVGGVSCRVKSRALLCSEREQIGTT